MRFKSVENFLMRLVFAELAQLVNAPALQAGDSEFKSRAPHQEIEMRREWAAVT